jgi:hypothetical protein
MASSSDDGGGDAALARLALSVLGDSGVGSNVFACLTMADLNEVRLLSAMVAHAISEWPLGEAHWPPDMQLHTVPALRRWRRVFPRAVALQVCGHRDPGGPGPTDEDGERTDTSPDAVFSDADLLAATRGLRFVSLHNLQRITNAGLAALASVRTAYLDRCSLDGRALKHLPRVQNLQLLSLTGERGVTDRHMTRLRGDALVDLIIRTPNTVTLAALARAFPRLASVALAVYTPDAFAPAAEPAPVLDLDMLVLTLADDMEGALPPFPLAGTVSTLQIANESMDVTIDDAWFEHLNVGRLSLFNCPTLSDAAFASLGALTELDLANCDGIIGDALQPLADSLARLFVGECSNFTGAGLAQLDALHALSVDRCPSFPADAFDGVCDACPDLCHVTVRWRDEDDSEAEDDSDADVPFDCALAEELLGEGWAYSRDSRHWRAERTWHGDGDSSDAASSSEGGVADEHDAKRRRVE